jgi:hypothetical protein
MGLRLGAGIVFGVALVPAAEAQTPQGTSFTYQGRLTEAGALATGPYDFRFVLYDAPVDGAQVGPTVTVDDMMVTEGLFTVSLDFGSVFGSEKRWLELGVRLGADPGPYTPILPRQELTPGPSAIFSVAAGDALGLGGVPASQYVQTDDPRLSDARDPLPGSPDYVQNGSVPQPGASFNVGGTGTADILDATTQFNLGGARILSNAGTHNLFVGANAGAINSSGSNNSFFGHGAGAFNFSGFDNSFFGSSAGASNNTGDMNSFFGYSAGSASFSGFANTFVGGEAGLSNTAGNSNTYVGKDAGRVSTGDNNTFVGRAAGAGNTAGSNNTALGFGANVSVPTLSFATAVGSGAVASASNTVVLGRSTDTVQVPGSQAVAGALTVSGALGADVLDAATQFNLGGSRILSAPGADNVFAGIGAGTSNTGSANAFFGRSAGQANTTGGGNAFFGSEAGFSNTTSNDNSFFGTMAGRANLTGSGNSFFGSSAGASHTTGLMNSFFGLQAGILTTDGQQNAIFGALAGELNNGSFNAYFGQAAGTNGTTGSSNTFLGWFAGSNNTTGFGNTFVGSTANLDTFDTTSNFNTLLGANARVSTGLINATALGARAQVTQSNSLVLGGVLGVNGGSNTNVGIGTTAPNARLHVADGGNILFGSSFACPNVVGIAFAGSISNSCQNFSLHGGDGNTHINRPSNGTIFFKENNVTEVSIRPGGLLNLQFLGGGGTTALCRNALNDVSTCSSSLRYKTDVAPFRGGLELVERLRPIRFTWKANGQRDIGLAAEEVANVEPLLAFRNARGEIEGVNYSQLTAVLVNALQQQQREIDALKALVCQVSPEAAPCQDAPPAR